MAQFSKGFTFYDNTTGHVAAELHALIENAHILPAVILDQPAAIPQGGDRYLFVQVNTGVLKSVTQQNLILSFPKDAAASTYSLRRLGVGPLMACAGNDGRLRNTLTGPRVGQGTGIDRVAIPSDSAFPTVSLSGKTIIDWDAGDIFYDTLGANKTYTFAHTRDGRSVQLIFKKNGHVPTLPVSIGTVVVGSGTTFLHVFLTSSTAGITGLQIQI